MIASLPPLSIDHALSPITSAYGSACKSPFATYVVLTLDKLASNLRNKPRQQTILHTQQKNKLARLRKAGSADGLYAVQRFPCTLARRLALGHLGPQRSNVPLVRLDTRRKLEPRPRHSARGSRTRPARHCLPT